MIIWRNQMSVGVPAIDEDHKGLFLLVNKLELCQSWEYAENIAKKLYAYTQSHFKREEKIQEQFNFPLFNEQRDEHRKIINDLSSVIKTHFLYKSPSTAVNDVIANLIPLLRDWLLGHVLVHDMKMRDFFALQSPAEIRLLSSKSHRFLTALESESKHSKWRGLSSGDRI